MSEIKLSNDMQLLSEVIGPEKTMEVIANLSGISLYVPKPDYTVIRYFHQKMGGQPKKTAQRLGVSERMVYRAIADGRDDPRQRSIFDELAEQEHLNS